MYFIVRETTQKIIELYTALTDSNRRYTYLLLAIAASAIALTFRSTENEMLNWILVPAGIAVLLWALSFYNGLKYITSAQAVMYQNIKVIDFEANNQNTPDNEERYQEMISELKLRTTIAEKRSDWQYVLLFAGAVSYTVWHVLKLYINTYCH